MKKGFYYIQVNDKGKRRAVKVEGYIIPDPQSGLTFGARFTAGNGWEITESSTGLLISTYEHKPKTSKNILQFINDMRAAVLSAMSACHIQKTIENFNDLVEEAKANDN